MPTFKQPSVLPGFGLTFGFTIFTLSAIVLMPLAALVIKTAGLDWKQFLSVVLDPRAVASYRLTFGSAFLAAAINAVFGFIIAWTLVRYEFPGRRIIDALIDMPFALPTAVSGIALTAVFAANGPIGRYLEEWGVKVAYSWIGVVVALTLIGMPFVVRSVQPALLEVQRDLEDAAETLGATRFTIFWRIIIPTVLPALLTGFAMALGAIRLLRCGRAGICDVDLLFSHAVVDQLAPSLGSTSNDEGSTLKEQIHGGRHFKRTSGGAQIAPGPQHIAFGGHSLAVHWHIARVHVGAVDCAFVHGVRDGVQ